MNRYKNKKAYLLALAFNNKDEHKRLTKGENFLLAGGSEEVHEKMTEGAMKINETLKKRGKQLEDLGKNEFVDLALEFGLIKE